MNKNNGCKITILVVSFKKEWVSPFPMCIMRMKYGTFLFLAHAILMDSEPLEQVMHRNIKSIIKYTC